MHKKSIEAAKALKEDDGSCDGDGNSESGNPQRQPMPLGPSAIAVDGSLDRGPRPSSGRRSDGPSPGGGVNGAVGGDALRSDSIAALRAKVW